MSGLSAPPRIAVLGMGAIGDRHAGKLAASPAAKLCAVADPSEAARARAADLGVPHYPDIGTLIDAARPDGVIVATPTSMHVENARACIAAGIPVLVEKPLGATVEEAVALVAQAEATDVPLLVGHHRRHNPVVAAATTVIEEGRLGRIVAINALIWLMKPDSYFVPDWRRAPGAGPILTNLIHDIDLMRHFCGEIVDVQAASSEEIRGHAVEDTAAVTLRFASGALGTMSVSDTAVGPWSWELTAAENPDYPATGQSCYWIAGTKGALELPNLTLWRNPGRTGWFEPLERETVARTDADPLDRQIAHFAEVIQGRAAPLVSGRDGLASLEVVSAVLKAARTGRAIPTHPEAHAA